jgi:hypothetical protein
VYLNQVTRPSGCWYTFSFRLSKIQQFLLRLSGPGQLSAIPPGADLSQRNWKPCPLTSLIRGIQPLDGDSSKATQLSSLERQQTEIALFDSDSTAILDMELLDPRTRL